jgi:hypothetical protein
MRKRLCLLLVVALAAAFTAAAASIDGKWKTEMKMPEGKKGRGGTIVTILELKAEGDKITGKVTNSINGRERTVEIQDGKLDGNTFTFTTVQQGRGGGEMKLVWSGTVSGDELKGTRGREAGRGMPFTAKRQ